MPRIVYDPTELDSTIRAGLSALGMPEPGEAESCIQIRPSDNKFEVDSYELHIESSVDKPRARRRRKAAESAVPESPPSS